LVALTIMMSVVGLVLPLFDLIAGLS